MQTTQSFILGGVKPNLVLAVLAVLAVFHKKWIRRVILVMIAALIVTFSPIITWFDLIFTATILLIMAIIDFAPWRKFISIAVAVISGTLILNVVSFTPRVVLTELLMNIALATIIFSLLQLIYVEEKDAKTNRF